MFRKTNISYPLISTRTYLSGGKKCESFGKFCVRTKLMNPKYYLKSD